MKIHLNRWNSNYNILFSHLVISTSAPSTDGKHHFFKADAVFSVWSTPFGCRLKWCWCMCSLNSTVQDLLTLLQYVSKIRLKAVRSHDLLRNRATVKMLKGNICSGNICAGGFSKPTAPLFCVDSCKHFCWLVVTFHPFWRRNFLSLFRPWFSISSHCISCHKLLFSNSTSFSHSDRWKPWQSHHQGPMPHGCKRNWKCFS